MRRTLSRRLWVLTALGVAVAVGYGWHSGVIRQWATDGRMALFRVSLARELSRDGARWTVRSSANVRGELWIVHLDRDGVDSAGVYLLFFPSSEAARDQFAKSGNAFVPPILTSWVKGTSPPPVQSGPPIISHTSLRGVGQANFVWDADRGRNPAVVKFRQDRVIGQVFAGSVTDAERVARKAAELIAGQRLKMRESRRVACLLHRSRVLRRPVWAIRLPPSRLLWTDDQARHGPWRGVRVAPWRACRHLRRFYCRSH